MNISIRYIAVLCGLTYAAHAQHQTPVTQLDELLVEVVPTSPCAVVQTREEMTSNPLHNNSAQAITQVPGVSAVHRNADFAEPVIRGLGWERVATQLDSLPLYSSCPSRMDPPAACVSGGLLQSAEVVKGMPSVTHGPGGTAGRVLLRSALDPAEVLQQDHSASAEITWNEARDGVSAALALQAATNGVALRGSATYHDLGDYESGGGKTVPAGNESYGAALSAGFRPQDNQLIYGTWNVHQVDQVDYPALPMDTVDSTANTFTAGYEAESLTASLKTFEVKLGYSDVDHTMDNHLKPNRKIMAASTESSAQSLGAKVAGGFALSESGVLTLGVDYQNLERDALRTRSIAATGATLRDRLWPDTQQQIAGLFAEWNMTLNDSMVLRLGGRVDYVDSEAAAVNSPLMLGPAFMGMNILDGYERYYGEVASDINRDETLGAANGTLEWSASERISFFTGLGLSSRAAGITERYFSFAAAPGGYKVGNPSLDPEQKLEWNAGTLVQTENTLLEFSAFVARVDDYISSYTIDRQDLNRDGTPDAIRGFKNVDAELYGAELGGRHAISESLSLPFSLAYVRGKNTSDDRNLPEIPPLSGSVALRLDVAGAHAWWLQSGLRFAMKQDQIDSGFSETETPSYQVVDLSGGVDLFSGWAMEVGIENLFDEDYAEHLSREAIMPAGDLKAGEKVPQPGRMVYVSLRCAL